MRFESVTAHAFGPFSGETLSLAPGLNVIWGPNEAGKSTWHAALYFGLCARRRGAGNPGADATLLRARHEPWGGDRWEVELRVALADGRRIGLRHDLRQLVACRATDLDLGRDCSDEILVGNDAPDGARWLGLDRRSFLAVACVRQADLIAVRDNAALLQEHLQRAAATGGADATAASALERVEGFRRSRVGATHSTAVGPRKCTDEAVAAARAELDAARRAHDAYGAQAARADEAATAEDAARARLATTEAALRRAEAEPTLPPSAAAGGLVQPDHPTAARRPTPTAARRPTPTAARRANLPTVSRPRPNSGLVATGGLVLGSLAAAIAAGIGAPTWFVVAALMVVGVLALVWLAPRMLGGRRTPEASPTPIEDEPGIDLGVFDAHLSRLRAAHADHVDAYAALERLGQVAADLRGQRAERERHFPSVAEAEEALAAVQAELDRVQALARTLDLTRQFLEQAEARVHRDLAPTLGRAVERWLPAVTNGRYTRALVDPETLAVTVAGPNGIWRDAALLSHGTAEQVYLLLRIALAECLTRRGEVCPLILDDVTAHFDADRTRAMLDTLRRLAAERQVILFSQEDTVLAWADACLRGPEHQVSRLRAPVGAA